MTLIMTYLLEIWLNDSHIITTLSLKLNYLSFNHITILATIRWWCRHHLRNKPQIIKLHEL